MALYAGWPRTMLLSNIFGNLWILLTLVTAGDSTKERTIGPTEICVKDTFNATCREGEVILIQMARYGRMQIGRCIPEDLGYLGCVSDVTDVLMAKCGGRRQCDVKVVDDDLMTRSVCYEQLTNHLEVTYKCVEAYSVNPVKCRTNTPMKIVNEDSGYISLNFHEHVLRHCPWEIIVRPGQKINLTLHSFTEQRKDGDDICYKVASFVEQGRPEEPILTCPNKMTTNVYTSSGNRIELRLFGKDSYQSQGPFLIQFQAINCPHLENTGRAITTYKGASAKVDCKHTGQIWYLTCKDTEWIGTAGNCTESGSKHSSNGESNPSKETSFPYGLLIAVAIGVALGVFCGGMLLGIVAVHKKRKRQKLEQRQESVYYGTKCPMVGQGPYCAEMNSLARDHVEVTATLTPCPAHRRTELMHTTPDTLDHPDNLYNKRELTLQHHQQPDLFLLDKNPTQVKERMKYMDALSPTAMQSSR